MQIALVSLFPEMFDAVSEHGVTGRAVKQGVMQFSYCNPRDYTQDKHRTVDDRPYGGGPGMLIKSSTCRHRGSASPTTKR
jgi:tRNA (guanine37-N1)-methyltransferase